MTRIVVLSAGLSNPSSTKLLADRLAAAAHSAFLPGREVEVIQIELRALAHEITDHLLTGFPAPALAAAQRQAQAADALIVVTPVFSASYSGLFKSFFDVLEPGALAAKPVLIAATGGTARHSLVLDHALRPLFSYLQAIVIPTGVFAATDDFAGTDLEARIKRAAGELARLVGGNAGARANTVADAVDGFSDVTPFESLLRAASSVN